MVEFDEMKIEDMPFDGELEVFEGHVWSCVVSEKYDNIWIDYNEISDLEFEPWCEMIGEKIVEKCNVESRVSNTIKKSFQKMADAMGLLIEVSDFDRRCNVFINSAGGDYCPYILSIDYDIENNTEITILQSWNVSRMYASGEKSDLYVLFANSMNILLKGVFNCFAEIVYIDVIGNDEVNAATILFEDKIKNCSIEKLSEKIDDIFMSFIMAMNIHYSIFGSYSFRLSTDEVNPKYISFYDEVEADNYIIRDDHQYYTCLEEGISLLVLSEKQYNCINLINNHKWEIIDGIDGKIIIQYEKTGKSYNFIPENRWKCVNKIIRQNALKNYTIICQENMLYVLELNTIWLIEGGYYHYWIEEEKQKIFERQKRENDILFFDKNFAWKYPVNPSRFEDLIADLIETDIKVNKVRLLGKSNNSDGGRDILIYKRILGEQEYNSNYLVIGQCKAYKNSVNKAHVTDIRDMIEHYGANGFFLAVTSNITVPLIDVLCKLGEKYEVDWWTQREIFSLLRKNFYLVERYSDLVEIIL
ncbi:hypothetical protein HMPREF9469_03059 [ [[Clostridium] citroniae WAL-17108]|mgnify:FL=1|uniref:Restriction endonuclease type IV Mrr domain-containing protein n=1 Tax=[Clostridium] citroniae WAL-17108 TaxID=742733 RepID=G5HKE7_9FIRM|nr:hypothetical protein HMPREF9469_03059 [ [[Clostridium] citroniae WAL-17108]